jgi:hypothetical protein
VDCLTFKSIKMKRKHLISFFLLALSAVLFSSCYMTEDPGPLQETERTYAIINFDRLEMGSAFNIEVEHAEYFDITVRGDRRNIDDLHLRKEGNTLVVRFDDQRERRHDTYITIKMPALLSANFSGASDSRVLGFNDLTHLDVYVSGGSVCRLEAEVADINAVVSGASYLNIRGEGEVLEVELSGASVLKAFNFPVSRVDLGASGASDADVAVSHTLNAVATGASVVTFRGNPVVNADVSGYSTVRRE